MGGTTTCHYDHPHHEDSKLQAFISQTSKQVCKQVLQVAEQTFCEPNVKEELTIDLSYQNGVVETPQCGLRISSSCQEVSDLGIATVDSIFCKGNTVPRLESSYERFESCLESHVSSDCASLSRSCLRVDTPDPNDLFHRSRTVSKLKTYCYSTSSYLQFDFRNMAENPTNLIHKSNHFPGLESGWYSHVSASYLPVPEPSLSYADFVTLNTADFLHLRSQVPKRGARDYIHVSTSYLPLHSTHSEADFTNSVQENNSTRGLNSCICNHIQSSYQKSCPDFEIDEVYKPLSPEDCTLSLQFSVQEQY